MSKIIEVKGNKVTISHDGEHFQVDRSILDFEPSNNDLIRVVKNEKNEIVAISLNDAADVLVDEKKKKYIKNVGYYSIVFAVILFAVSLLVEFDVYSTIYGVILWVLGLMLISPKTIKIRFQIMIASLVIYSIIIISSIIILVVNLPIETLDALALILMALPLIYIIGFFIADRK